MYDGPNCNEEQIIFQSGFAVDASDTEILPIPQNMSIHKTDQLNAFLHRDDIAYAIGHTCSADWDEKEKKCIEVRTEWLPSHLVFDMDTTGHSSLDGISLNAKELSINSKNKNINERKN